MKLAVGLALGLLFVLLGVLALTGQHDPQAGWEPGRLDPRPSQPAPQPSLDAIEDPGGTGARFVARRQVGQTDLDPAQAAEIARLEALGYASGSMRGRGRSGISIHESALVHAGTNVYIDGESPTARLIDMDGKVLHSWHCPFERAFPGRSLPRNTIDTGFFRRVHVFDNGDLLALFEGQGMIKLDRDSKLLWSYPVAVHHDMHVMDDGSIHVLTRSTEVAPRISEQPILHDAIDVLTPDGKRTRRVSVLRALERSSFADMLQRLGHGGDILHTNTLKILDGRHAGTIAAFKQGNALISILTLNMIAVIDMESETIVWALHEGWFRQHEPTLLEDGNLLLFDNGSGRFSRVLEIDPRTRRVLWQYGGPGVDFYSRTCGTAQRLGNGNTLVVETDQGRAFELTRDRRIVWEFHTPHRAGPDDGLIASLFQMQRLRDGFPLDWLQNRSK